MKTPKIVNAIIIALALLTSASSKAQLASVTSQNAEEKQRILVDMKISPSVSGFRAGISLIDSVQNKLGLWVSNGNEKKFSVSITDNTGYLWNSNFTEAYLTRVFDLSRLDDGEYFIKVNCGRENFERTIIIATNNYIKRDFRIR